MANPFVRVGKYTVNLDHVVYARNGKDDENNEEWLQLYFDVLGEEGGPQVLAFFGKDAEKTLSLLSTLNIPF